ncbi:MAG: hypothetical protein WC069_00615 [Candidatus Shapirobacteria bacterium]
MKNTLSDFERKNFECLLDQVSKNEEEKVEKYQEQYMTIVSLISDKQFLNRIIKMRHSFKIPNEFYGQDKEKKGYDSYLDYVNKTPNTPVNSYDKPIVELCNEYNVEWKLYGDMILDFLYYGTVGVSVPPDYEWFEYHFTPEEYRYKTKIELDYGEAREKFVDSEVPIKLSLRIYKDTTKTKLINFIKENWKDISNIKKSLCSYPLSKKYKYFRRDLLVYIYYKLGYKVKEILEKLNYVSDDEDPKNFYNIENTAVRQIVVDFKKRIKDIR